MLGFCLFLFQEGELFAGRSGVGCLGEGVGEVLFEGCAVGGEVGEGGVAAGFTACRGGLFVQVGQGLFGLVLALLGAGVGCFGGLFVGGGGLAWLGGGGCGVGGGTAYRAVFAVDEPAGELGDDAVCTTAPDVDVRFRGLLKVLLGLAEDFAGGADLLVEGVTASGGFQLFFD
ncbi:hypothetical protein AB0912_34005 [Streptomyces sp. NPDC007084]|uniref:hypothetical protein n=1 Tax=Streptomyces sp. NPDC007084 TaxID=3154313 RepID=UPI0034519743